MEHNLACPTNRERLSSLFLPPPCRQIQANSRGDRDRAVTASARRTSVVFAARWKLNTTQRSDRQTFARLHPGIADDGAELSSARIE